VAGGRTGGCVADRCQQVRDGVQEPLPVPQEDLVDRTGGVGVFGCRVEEGAAAEARLPRVMDSATACTLPTPDGLLARAAAIWAWIARSA
jgi:hypothetical protein